MYNMYYNWRTTNTIQLRLACASCLDPNAKSFIASETCLLRTLFPPLLACYKFRVLCLEVSASRCDCYCHVVYLMSVCALHLLLSLNVAFMRKERVSSHCKFKLNSLSPFNVTGFPLLSNFSKLCSLFARDLGFRKRLETSIFICCKYAGRQAAAARLGCRRERKVTSGRRLSGQWIHFPVGN